MNFMTALHNAPLQTLSVTVGLGQRQPVRPFLPLSGSTSTNSSISGLFSVHCDPSPHFMSGRLHRRDVLFSGISVHLAAVSIAYSRILYL
jgi:hypothetical protein